MATVHKKHEEEISNKKQAISNKKEEPVVVSDVVTETTERIEVIEEATPDKAAPAVDPLTEFKEKMIEEESLPSDMSPKKNFMWPILFIFIITLLLLGGIFVWKKGAITGGKINVVTLTPSPTVVPSPTITIDLTKYEIKVLNGSEVDGEAGRQKSSLETEGFTVSTVGNADNSDYTDTVIQAKKEVEKDFIAKLKSVLEDSFTVGDTESLSDSASTPVVIILGTKK